MLQPPAPVELGFVTVCMEAVIELHMQINYLFHEIRGELMLCNI